jgi:hypothetical protein
LKISIKLLTVPFSICAHNLLDGSLQFQPDEHDKPDYTWKSSAKSQILLHPNLNGKSSMPQRWLAEAGAMDDKITIPSAKCIAQAVHKTWRICLHHIDFKQFDGTQF